MITLPKSTDALTEHAIPTPDGEFRLLLKRPTYAERLEDDSLGILAFAERSAAAGLVRQATRRIESCCVGWSGVQDEAGNAVPFSIEALTAVFSAYPSVTVQVQDLIAGLYRRTDSVGESVAPPVAGTAADPAASPRRRR